MSLHASFDIVYTNENNVIKCNGQIQHTSDKNDKRSLYQHFCVQCFKLARMLNGSVT